MLPTKLWLIYCIRRTGAEVLVKLDLIGSNAFVDTSGVQVSLMIRTSVHHNNTVESYDIALTSN